MASELKRKPRVITNKSDIDFLLSLNEDTITKSNMMNMFGEFDGSPRFNPYDEVKIPPNSFGPIGKQNKNEFITTVGLWIYNRLFNEREMFPVFKYINHEITGGVLEDYNKELSYLILEDELTIDDLKPYLHKQQWMMRFVSILAPNHTMKMLTITDYLKNKKEKLIKQHQAELDNGNELISAEIEKELLSDAQNYLKDDPSMDMYNSKARSKFNNHFKNMFVMRGAIMNPDPTKGFDISTSNLMDGISKKDYTVSANSLVAGAYAKSKNTAVGGYWAKLFTQAYQHLTLDPTGSDCGTKKYITIQLTSKNIDQYMYCYVIEGSKLIEITSKNRKSYIDKTVKIRFSTKCESKTGFCNKCAGNLYYRLGITNIGLTSPSIPNKVMLLSMKKFHNMQIRIATIDPYKAFNII